MLQGVDVGPNLLLEHLRERCSVGVGLVARRGPPEMGMPLFVQQAPQS